MQKGLSRLSRANLIQHQQSSSSFAQVPSEKQHRLSAANEVWRDVDDFLLEHVGEVLRKFDTKSSQLDDEIWGKIVLMEGGRRLAKAYLRNPVVVVDGSDYEFDGLRIGFNHFQHVASFQQDFCKKIGDGVVIKMDSDGNIKAMARGTAPIYIQGKLTPKSASISDNDRIHKIFDMRQFKSSLAEMTSSRDIRSLLFKTCTRIAMVRDGGEDNLSKTPCWFLLVNMIAIEMVRRKLSLPDPKIEKLVLEPESLPSNSPVIAAKDPLISLLTAAIQKVQNGCVEVPLETDSNGEDMMQKLATKLAMSIIAKQEETHSVEKSFVAPSPALRLSSCDQRQNYSPASVTNYSEVVERDSLARKHDLQQCNSNNIPSRISSSTLSSSSSSLFLSEEPVKLLGKTRIRKEICLQPANHRCRRPRMSKSVVHTNQGQQFYNKLSSPQNRHSEGSHINTSDYESHSNGNGMLDVVSSLSYNSSPESDTDSNNSEKQFDYLDVPRVGLYRTQMGFETDSVPHYYSQSEGMHGIAQPFKSLEPEIPFCTEIAQVNGLSSKGPNEFSASYCQLPAFKKASSAVIRNNSSLLESNQRNDTFFSLQTHITFTRCNNFYRTTDMVTRL